MIYAQPGTPGAVVSFKPRYGNYIGGEFVPPVKGEYFVNTSPVNGEVIAEFPRSGAEDIERALDAAHAAADAWGRTSVQDRANILLKIADRIEANLEKLAVAETWDNGKPLRETMAADLRPYAEAGTVDTVRTNLTGAKYTLATNKAGVEAGITDFASIAAQSEALDGKIYGIPMEVIRHPAHDHAIAIV